MKNSHKALLLATSLFALFGATAASATSVFVTSANPGGWAFSNTIDSKGSLSASGDFVSGPSTPPLGTGSAQLTATDPLAAEILYHGNVRTSISTLSTLSYSTYVTTSTPGSGSAATLQFDIYNGATFDGRLVFDPGLLGTVTDNTWQSWDAGTADAWYFSHPALGNCTLAGPYCTLTQALGILGSDVEYDAVLFKAGSGQSNFVGNVDDFAFNGTVYDFEDTAVPEPLTLSLFGAGLAGAVLLRRRKRTPKAG